MFISQLGHKKQCIVPVALVPEIRPETCKIKRRNPVFRIRKNSDRYSPNWETNPQIIPSIDHCKLFKIKKKPQRRKHRRCENKMLDSIRRRHRAHPRRQPAQTHLENHHRAYRKLPIIRSQIQKPADGPAFPSV